MNKMLRPHEEDTQWRNYNWIFVIKGTNYYASKSRFNSQRNVLHYIAVWNFWRKNKCSLYSRTVTADTFCVRFKLDVEFFSYRKYAMHFFHQQWWDSPAMLRFSDWVWKCICIPYKQRLRTKWRISCFKNMASH